MRTRAIVMGMGLVVVSLLMPALAQRDDPAELQGFDFDPLPALELGEHAAGPKDFELYDQLDEARLNAEFLEIEYQGLKNQAAQQVQMLTGFEYGDVAFPLVDGRPLTAEESDEQRRQQIVSIRKRYDQLKAATLEAGRRLRREKQRVLELERRLGEKSVDKSDLERRLEAVERKLDEVLKAMEAKGRG